ncbi:MAG: exodeoxyribonuclease VII large subunit, partial [Dehalococcoidia bacterium]
VVDFARPEGVGIVNARFEQLKAKLEAEGLFDPGRKRPLPAFPMRIGVVTSSTGAALQDIRNVLTRRWPLAELVLAAATVQGEQAAPQLVGALAQLAREPIDVAILARGGGSAEDLSAFNDERVARAVFGFPVPVVTGVGHETDETIVDWVADVRAPTPSAAAERATPSSDEVGRMVVVLQRAMASACREGLVAQATAVDTALGRMRRAGPDLGHLARGAERLVGVLEQQARRALADERGRLEGMGGRLGALDPRATLARGFAIVQEAETRKVISRTKQVKPGRRLQVSVSDGAFWSEVS